jgi:anti-sigma regulatory factor (Ser/Thr protein kinase)/anti-anti-sigma regulatory factor
MGQLQFPGERLSSLSFYNGMSASIIVGPSLDEFGFENLLSQLSRIDIRYAGNIEIDLSGVEFIDPFGLAGLLEAGCYISRVINKKLILHLPISSSVIGYLQRMGFLEMASSFFEFQLTHSFIDGPGLYAPGLEDVLLKLTKIEGSQDIHNIVNDVRESAASILQSYLNYDEESIASFLVALSEICQNIPEHSQDIGLIGIQKYFYKRRLNKNVVKIAVMDIGIGIRESLRPRFDLNLGQAWSDLMALEKVLLEGVSRYDDPGRGQGLIRVRELIEKWNGRISIRSHTAKVMILPQWDRSRSRQNCLHYFPGTQINIILPEIPS